MNKNGDDFSAPEQYLEGVRQRYLERVKQRYPVGSTVVARYTITESGEGEGDPNAKFPEPGWVHAHVQDMGSVEGIDYNGQLTVRFHRTRTATIVGYHEIEPCVVHAGTTTGRLSAAAPNKGGNPTTEVAAVSHWIRESLGRSIGEEVHAHEVTLALQDKIFAAMGSGGQLKRMCPGVDYADIESQTLVYFLTAWDPETQTRILRSLGVLSEHQEVISVSHDIHDSYTVHINDTRPLEMITLSCFVPPAKVKEEKRHTLLVHMPSSDEDEPQCILAVDWDKERLAELQARIGDAERMLKVLPNLEEMRFAFEWGFALFVAEDEAEWDLPLVWPRSFCRGQNEETGSDRFGLGGLIGAGMFDVAFVNGREWRERTSEDEDVASDSCCYISVRSGDDGVLFTFEQYATPSSPLEDVRYESIVIGPRLWMQLTDATMTLEHLEDQSLPGAVEACQRKK